MKSNKIYAQRTEGGDRRTSSRKGAGGGGGGALHSHGHSLEPIIYIVRQGDTLTRIAQTHDVSLNQLIKKNRLSKLNGKVLRGQKLVIPATRQEAI